MGNKGYFGAESFKIENVKFTFIWRDKRDKFRTVVALVSSLWVTTMHNLQLIKIQAKKTFQNLNVQAKEQTFQCDLSD